MNNEISDIYFDVLEVIAVGNFCPHRHFCLYEKAVDTATCIECISEFIIKSGKFSSTRVNEILGE